MANRDEDRVRITAGAGTVHVEIRPLVRTRAGRVRVAAVAGLLLAAALLAAARLGQAWEAGFTKGDFVELPLPLLLILSLAVGISTPLAFLGVAALAFAEESIDVDRDSVTIRTSVFESTRVRRLSLSDVDCWRETYLPLSPWWTWAVRRLAARHAGRLEPVAGAAGPEEKKLIAQALARATGRPIVGDWDTHGRIPRVPASPHPRVRVSDAETRGRPDAGK